MEVTHISRFVGDRAEQKGSFYLSFSLGFFIVTYFRKANRFLEFLYKCAKGAKTLIYLRKGLAVVLYEQNSHALLICFLLGNFPTP